MRHVDPSVALRQRLVQCLTRASQALVDESIGYQDALAIARNMAAAVIADVDTMGTSPVLAHAQQHLRLVPHPEPGPVAERGSHLAA